MNIHLITDSTGFPNGTAAARRIRMIGKAMIASGCSFSVYTNTLSDYKTNKSASGKIDNIHFNYLHGSIQYPFPPSKKIWLYIKGVMRLNARIKKMNSRKDVVYIYSQGNIFNIITLFLCKIYGIRKVEEINEWDYEQMKGPLRKFIFRVPMVKWADGAIVISKSIKDNVLQIRPDFKTVTIPVLDDPAHYTEKENVHHGEQYIFWMGLVDGYLKDVLLIVEACGIAYQSGCKMNLVIGGPCKKSLDTIRQKALSVNFPEENLKMVGYQDDDSLHELCRNALFYIVPLWEDQKSRNRFPTKIATFMFCGRPILTCNIGEVGDMFTENENVLFFKPGDSIDLASKIGLIYNDSILYNRICTNSKKLALEKFNYEQYIDGLYGFFSDILEAKESGEMLKRSVSHG